MIAVALVSSSSTSFLVGLAATLAAAVLVAHWGAGAFHKPQVKRMIAAGLIAFSLATVAVRAEELIYTPIDWCWVYTLNPSDWYAWLRCVAQLP